MTKLLAKTALLQYALSQPKEVVKKTFEITPETVSGETRTVAVFVISLICLYFTTGWVYYLNIGISIFFFILSLRFLLTLVLIIGSIIGVLYLLGIMLK